MNNITFTESSREEKIQELQITVMMLLRKYQENEAFKDKIKILKEEQNKYDTLINQFMKITNKKNINLLSDKISIESKTIKKVKPANKKFIKERTLDLCDGDEEKTETFLSELFSKDNLQEYEIKKLKIKAKD